MKATPTTTGLAPTSDGDHLPYAIHTAAAAATPFLVLNGLLSSGQHWPFFLQHYAARRPIVTFDYRGHGVAPPPRDPAALTVASLADDAHAVAVAARPGPKVLAGLSFGVQVALEHWRRHPGDVRALVLICGTSGHPLDRLSGRPAVRRAFARVARGLGAAPRLTRALMAPAARTSLGRELAYLSGGAHRDECPREVLDDLFAHVAGLDPRVIGACVAAYVEHSAWDVLPTIRVPTLLIAGDRDELVPLAVAERMRAAIPGARLVVFPGHSHLVQVEKPAEVHAAIDAFLADHGL